MIANEKKVNLMNERRFVLRTMEEYLKMLARNPTHTWLYDAAKECGEISKKYDEQIKRLG